MRQAVRARVDLGPGKTTVETLNEREVRTWGGERGLALPVLASRLTRETDPLSPENTLVVAAGLLNGLAFPGTCRYGVYAKSPLTGAFGESEAGGSFGPAMRAQGIDAIVLEGASERPVYLWVENGSVTVHDASDLWGKPNRETLEALTARLVGPAGAPVAAAILAGLAVDPARPLDATRPADANLLRRILAFAAMSAEFQTC